MNIEEIIIDSDDNSDHHLEQEGFIDDAQDVKIEENDFSIEAIDKGLLLV